MAGIGLMLVSALCLNDTTCIGNLTRQEIEKGITPNITAVPINAENYKQQILSTNKTNLIKGDPVKKYLNGARLKITTLYDYPLSYHVVDANGIMRGKGVAFDLIDFLALKYNFTYDLVLPALNIIGSPVDGEEEFNKSMIKILEDNKADLAAAFVPNLVDIRDHIQYSTTTLDEGEWIMIMKRPPESASGSGLLAPFDFWVWILILISLLIVGPVIYLMIMLRNKLTGDDSQIIYSFGHCAWFVYGALMKQGSTLSPLGDSTRLLFATWWLFITILTSFYTANLTAFLTLSKFTLPFNTKEDILKAQKEFACNKGFGVDYAMRTENESLYDLNVLIQKNKLYFTIERNDTLNLKEYVDQKNLVFVRDRPAVTHMLYRDYTHKRKIGVDDEKLQCPFAISKKPFMTKKRGFVYPQENNKPVEQRISRVLDAELLNLVESGIIKYLSAKDLPNAEICPQNLNSNERQLRNGDLMMTYYIMAAGFATAMAVFFSEMVFRFLNMRREKQADEEFLRKVAAKRSEWGQQGHQLSGGPSNHVTPPPPYGSIFSYQKNKKGNISKIPQDENDLEQSSEHQQQGVKRVINGREYMVYKNSNGESQLVPVRAPSAALFQYSYAK